VDASQSKRPAALITLAFCLLLLALGGFAGAYGMLMDPSGAGMGLPLSLLENTPVTDYLLPGLFLLIVYGIAPLATVYGLWTLPAWPRLQALNPARRAHWAWRAAVALGIILILWIALEFLLWGYIFVLQPIFGVLGVVILALCYTPAVQAYAAMRDVTGM